jgi:hypothetical protein
MILDRQTSPPPAQAFSHRAIQMSDVGHELQVIASVFDPAYYECEYPDLALSGDRMLEHFCRHGWREGRNPNLLFDTVSYISAYDDVAQAGINPYYHYLCHGFDESRTAYPAVTPSICSETLFGYRLVDWVARIRPHVDTNFYAARLPAELSAQIDLAAHFAYRGWREGHSLSEDFPLQHWTGRFPDCKRLGVNPFVLKLELESGCYEPAALATCAAGSLPAVAARLDESEIGKIRAEFSASFYLRQNPDVAAAAIDPLRHYLDEGWKEGRNPSKAFDTAYYLRHNPDVAVAGVNPFWHYLAQGRDEGRRPIQAGGQRRRMIDDARAPERRTEEYVPPSRPGAVPALVESILNQAGGMEAGGGRGLVISLSHDCYIESVGGTQIFIADEQRKFNADGYTYLQLSPHHPRLAFAPEDDAVDLRMVIDGRDHGRIAISELAPMIARLAARDIGHRVLVLHSFLGFNSTAIATISRAFRPQDSFYWLHDYSSLCAGYNLLRNDVAFCHAPPPDSMACRVCVYGTGRALHLQETLRIFEQCDLQVLAPSRYALDLWSSRQSLPFASAAVHAHWRLRERQPIRRRQALTGRAAPVRVAFVGFPTASKGWPFFHDLVEHMSGDPGHRFYHFEASGARIHPAITPVATAVTSASRWETVKLLSEHDIDIVLVLSTWPETFSFVAHEAMIAGAAVICLSDSGNVAALVERTGRGCVVDDDRALLRLFDTGGAAALVETLRRRQLPRLTAEQSGTTATVVMEGPAAAPMAAHLATPLAASGS